MSRLLVLCMVVIPFIQARKTLHGYTLYDPAKYECKVVDGGWTDWSCFSSCSVSCGKGYQKRYRHCTAPVAKYGGKTCSGDHIEARECDTKLECPIDGGWSDEVKGNCPVSCGGGHVEFTKTCNNPTPKHCGKQCVGQAVRTEPCNTHKCPGWTEWKCTDCYRLNGKCKKICKRTCIYHKTDKKYCVGESSEERTCHESKCKSPHPGRGLCKECYDDAQLKAGTGNYPTTFVGHACRATNLAAFCREKKDQNDLSKNGGYPSDHWFWIHCSPDGPWCKPCATRTLFFNKKCDACEASRDGPCTGVKISKKDYASLDDEDLWK
jgi:hypothetical protein